MTGRELQGVPGGSPAVGGPARAAARPPAIEGTARSHGGRWRPRNWRLRWKLLIVLLVPLLTAAALGSLQVVSEARNASVYDRVGNDLKVASALSTVVDNLQREREQVTLYAASTKTTGAAQGTTDSNLTDQSVQAFRGLAGSVGDTSAQSQQAVASAETSLADLNALRDTANSTNYPDIDIVAGYSQIIAQLLQDTQVDESGIADQQVFQVLQGLNDVRQAKEQYSQIVSIMVDAAQNASPPVSSSVPLPPLADTQLQSAQAQYQADVDSFNATASTADQNMFSNTVAGSSVDAANLDQLEIGVRAATGQPLQVSPTQIQSDGDVTASLIRGAELNLYNELQGQVSDLSSAAVSQAVRVALLVALALIIAFLIAALVVRSLVASLRRLRSGALDVAMTRLPQSVRRILADPDPIRASAEAVEPVPVFTADEIGEVARSFDVVHGQAVRLAAEQAVLRDNVNAIFVNLARRSQVLVERQLALIDRLERDEQDPDQLGNLFELDHLATRMRRNSESLLVLSGTGLAKRMSQPVPVGDLVGAAVSEVEQYARVEVGAPPDVQILGRVVNDLIHLIAELLDNATVFSEPNTKVSVRIAKTRSREVAIQVTDRGVGMSEEDVREANERLASPPEMDVNVTRRMGLYVVAQLAKRHAIRVKLRANEDIDGGTVALVVVPEDLIHREGEAQVTPLASPQQRTLPSEISSAPLIPVEPAIAAPNNTVGAAAAAAGIAGAFGASAMRGRQDAAGTTARPEVPEARPAVSNPPAAMPPVGTGPEPGWQGAENPLDPATSYWGATDFAEEPAQPAPTDEPTASPLLWEAHTAADELPAIGSELANEQLNGTAQPAPAPASAELDAPTERLPIYEAVLSQWFRPDAAAGEQGAEATPAAASPPAAAAPTAAPTTEPPTVYAKVGAPPSTTPEPAPIAVGGLPTRVPGRAGKAAGFGTNGRRTETEAEPPASTPVAASSTATAAQEAGWQTPADEGWQAAAAAMAPVADLTTAGLPKRVPKAHLVPGSAAPREPSPQAASAPPLPPRSAEAVRGRMSSFQRGVRRGRHALIEAYSGGASPLSDGSHDEEHE